MLIDDLRAVVVLARFVHSGRGGQDAVERVAALVAAYDALAPDWNAAPEWAMWYAIDAHGRAEWYESEPRWFNIVWSNADYHDRAQAAQERDDYNPLPVGLDARLCKWRRPAQEASDDT